VVINTATKRVEKIYSTCKKCHGTIGIEVPDDDDGGRPFLCAVDVARAQRKFPAPQEPLASFTERKFSSVTYNKQEGRMTPLLFIIYFPVSGKNFTLNSFRHRTGSSGTVCCFTLYLELT
jgi:hypothetical protein